jgi:hypothetical protein
MNQPVLSESTRNEGKILLAISSIEKGQIQSVKRAAEVYDVPIDALESFRDAIARPTRESSQIWKKRLLSSISWIWIREDFRPDSVLLKIWPIESWLIATEARLARIGSQTS